MKKLNSPKLQTILKNGGIAVIPTDTIYGICGSALLPKTVKKIYYLRKRNLKKPMIILIGQISDLGLFGIRPSPALKNKLAKFWPGKVSIVFNVPLKKFAYLHRGKKSLAFRMPNQQHLIKLLMKTGPLVAPSANVEGEEPAHSVRQAKKTFGNKVDLYVDSGILKSLPSTLVLMRHRRVMVLRQGAQVVV
ncbi:MAG: L-threonylcarbamoyladenylate synthase [Candidatus Liptonbacteria bacterium]